MTSESEWWSGTLRKQLITQAGGGRWERVENGIADGTPDVNYCFASFEGWIELKVARLGYPGPRTKKTGVFQFNRGCSLAQVNWHLKQHSVGGISFILAYAPAAREVFLINGVKASLFNAYTRDELFTHARWASGDKKSRNDYPCYDGYDYLIDRIREAHGGRR